MNTRLIDELIRGIELLEAADQRKLLEKEKNRLLLRRLEANALAAVRSRPRSWSTQMPEGLLTVTMPDPSSLDPKELAIAKRDYRDKIRLTNQ